MLPEVGPLGLKGAAFAAFGEMAVVLMPGPVPLVASNEGVKLGDSTFNLLFRLTGEEYQQDIYVPLSTSTGRNPPLSLSGRGVGLDRIMIKSTTLSHTV